MYNVEIIIKKDDILCELKLKCLVWVQHGTFCKAFPTPSNPATLDSQCSHCLLDHTFL